VFLLGAMHLVGRVVGVASSSASWGVVYKASGISSAADASAGG